MYNNGLFTPSAIAVAGNPAVQTLVSGASVPWDVAAGRNSRLTILQNGTLSITNPVAGMTYIIAVTQGGGGGFVLSLPSNSYVVNGGAGDIPWSVAAGTLDIASAYYDGTNFHWTYGLGFTN